MPSIIAEVSCNHRGSFEEAKNLVRMARDCGAEYVKFQLYEPEQMAIAGNAAGLWSGSLNDLYKKAMTPRAWFEPLFGFASSIGIKAFSSVFDLDGLAFICRLNPPFIKIASFENTHYPLIEAAAKTGIPLIISTGMMTWNELHDLDAFIPQGVNVTYLKCTSAYPALPEGLNLGTIPEMQWRFPNRRIGYSDHMHGHFAAELATALGADMIERHIALADDALDAAFSSVGRPRFYDYVTAVKLASRHCGKYFGPHENELISLRRAVYCTKDIKQNELFSCDNSAALRGPGGGIHPKLFDALLRTGIATRALKRGEPITSDAVSWQKYPHHGGHREFRTGLHAPSDGAS